MFCYRHLITQNAEHLLGIFYALSICRSFKEFWKSAQAARCVQHLCLYGHWRGLFANGGQTPWQRHAQSTSPWG